MPIISNVAGGGGGSTRRSGGPAVIVNPPGVSDNLWGSAGYTNRTLIKGTNVTIRLPEDLKPGRDDMGYDVFNHRAATPYTGYDVPSQRAVTPTPLGSVASNWTGGGARYVEPRLVTSSQDTRLPLIVTSRNSPPVGVTSTLVNNDDVIHVKLSERQPRREPSIERYGGTGRLGTRPVVRYRSTDELNNSASGEGQDFYCGDRRAPASRAGSRRDRQAGPLEDVVVVEGRRVDVKDRLVTPMLAAPPGRGGREREGSPSRGGELNGGGGWDSIPASSRGGRYNGGMGGVGRSVVVVGGAEQRGGRLGGGGWGGGWQPGSSEDDGLLVVKGKKVRGWTGSSDDILSVNGGRGEEGGARGSGEECREGRNSFKQGTQNYPTGRPTTVDVGSRSEDQIKSDRSKDLLTLSRRLQDLPYFNNNKQRNNSNQNNNNNNNNRNNGVNGLSNIYNNNNNNNNGNSDNMIPSPTETSNNSTSLSDSASSDTLPAPSTSILKKPDGGGVGGGGGGYDGKGVDAGKGLLGGRGSTRRHDDQDGGGSLPSRGSRSSRKSRVSRRVLFKSNVAVYRFDSDGGGDSSACSSSECERLNEEPRDRKKFLARNYMRSAAAAPGVWGVPSFPSLCRAGGEGGGAGVGGAMIRSRSCDDLLRVNGSSAPLVGGGRRGGERGEGGGGGGSPGSGGGGAVGVKGEGGTWVSRLWSCPSPPLIVDNTKLVGATTETHTNKSHLASYNDTLSRKHQQLPQQQQQQQQLQQSQFRQYSNGNGSVNIIRTNSNSGDNNSKSNNNISGRSVVENSPIGRVVIDNAMTGNNAVAVYDNNDFMTLYSRSRLTSEEQVTLSDSSASPQGQSQNLKVTDGLERSTSGPRLIVNGQVLTTCLSDESTSSTQSVGDNEQQQQEQQQQQPQQQQQQQPTIRDVRNNDEVLKLGSPLDDVVEYTAVREADTDTRKLVATLKLNTPCRFTPSDIVVRSSKNGKKIHIVNNKNHVTDIGSHFDESTILDRRLTLPVTVDPYGITARLDEAGNLVIEAPIIGD